MNESIIQQQIIVWFNNNFCLKTQKNRAMIFSVPNDSANYLETKRKVNTGLLRGVSDLVVVLPNNIFFVEIKALKGVQSDSQQVFQERINNLGFEYYLIRSLEQFKILIYEKTRA